MEKNKQHVQEDAFLKKYLQEIKLDSPRSSFTENILDLILKEEKSIVKNTPLISKKMWFIAAGFLATCVFFLFKEKNTTSLRFPEIDFSFIPSLQMPTIFGSFTIPLTCFTIFRFNNFINNNVCCGWFFSNVFYSNCFSEKSF